MEVTHGGRPSARLTRHSAIALVYTLGNDSLSLMAHWLDGYTDKRYGRAVARSMADEAA